MRSVWVFVLFVLLGLTACPPPPAASCGPDTCSGCCDGSGQCQAGVTPNACGRSGVSCMACSGSTTCILGECSTVNNSAGGTASGGGSSGGGDAGGSAAGGDAGGSSMAGGSPTAGGSTAGGSTAGGSTAGGSTAGGSTAGGSAGGPTAGGSSGPVCAGTLSLCSGRCIDTLSDLEHCGGCGRICGQGEVCNRGVCALLPTDCTAAGAGCGPGFFCEPISRMCRSGCRLSTDCPMGATCSTGVCACPAGQHACGQQCVSDTAITSCGTSCVSCPLPSNGQATCQASTCGLSCTPGFRPSGNTCVDVDECATGNGGCSANATCTNTVGARTCACRNGFTGDGVTCTDLDECATSNGGCSADATCTNTPGARTCACRSGFSGDGVTCADVNECATNNGGCSTSATCTNTPGARTCSCINGFSGDGVTCADINECVTNNGGCASLASGGVCTNTPGSRTCTCAMGFTGDGLSCADLNECATNNGGCSVNGTCTNTPGSRTCACLSGFSGDGLVCNDINECSTNNGGCAAVASGGLCTNTPGSRTCACASGYAGDGFSCSDLNECATNNGGCAAVASGGVCTNTPGSRTCSCTTGYTGTGFTCSDINECLTANGGCAAVGGVCTNTAGGRTCACAAGYAGNGLTCIPSGERCTSPIPIGLGTSYGYTHSRAADETSPRGGACAGLPASQLTGPDTAFSFTPSTTERFHVAIAPVGDFSLLSFALTSCSGACTAADSLSLRNEFEVAGVAGTPIVIVVKTNVPGAVAVTITADGISTPAGDTCATALPLTAGLARTVAVVSKATDDTTATVSASCPDVGAPRHDIIFSFTPSTSGLYAFSETGTAYTSMWLSAGTCGGACVAFADGDVLSANLTAGVTYYLSVEPVFFVYDALTVRVDAVTAPANDTCAAPTVLPVSTIVTSNATAATRQLTGTTGALCTGVNTGAKETFTVFTPPTTGNYYVVSAGGASAIVMSSCGDLSTCVGGVNDSDPVSLVFNGVAGVPVYLASVGYPGSTSTTIRVFPVTGPTNDTCATAEPLTLSTPVTKDISYASNDLAPNTAACPATRTINPQLPDIVFSFTPATTGPYVFRDVSVNRSPRLFLMEGSCGDSACVEAPLGGYLQRTLQAGVTYYLGVEAENGNVAVVVDPAPPPANDGCTTPTSLTLNTSYSLPTVGATDTFNTPSTGACAMPAQTTPDTTYVFTPNTSRRYQLMHSGRRAWVSSACGNIATCQVASMERADRLIFNGFAGVPVFITIESSSWYPVSLQVIPAPAIPSGDSCPGTFLGTQTLLGAMSDLTPSSAACGAGQAGPEIVFSFTASSAGTYLFREATSSRVALWASNGTCGGASCIASSGAAESLLLTLTAGQTIYVVMEDLSTFGGGGAVQLVATQIP